MKSCKPNAKAVKGEPKQEALPTNISLNNNLKVLTMNDFKKDIIMGLIFITGIYGFISGEFILSTILFAVVAIYSNILLTHRLNK